ncbi:hypothetical protein L3Q82_020033, partial [Scortum barcoo]
AESPAREMKRPKANTFATEVKAPPPSSSAAKADLDEIRQRDAERLRVVSEEQVHCSLVMGKARVTPTKIVTIPRLELTAAVTSARQFDIQGHLLRFSKWTTAVNIIARIQRLAKRIKTSEPMSVEERRQAALTHFKRS